MGLLIAALGRMFKWSARVQMLSIAVVYPVSLAVLASAWFVGFLMPVQTIFMHWKIVALERHLYVGEGRSDLERQFGHGIPRPDRTVCCLTGSWPPKPAPPDANIQRYEYVAASTICYVRYEGMEVATIGKIESFRGCARQMRTDAKWIQR